MRQYSEAQIRDWVIREIRNHNLRQNVYATRVLCSESRLSEFLNGGPLVPSLAEALGFEERETLYTRKAVTRKAGGK